MKKVEISRTEKEYSSNWCRRCDKYYCANCVPLYDVDFDIKENLGRDDNPLFENWNGEKVCPWCYNQLVELKKQRG